MTTISSYTKNLGQEIPEELYKAIVEIYVYFLKFDPNAKKTVQQMVSTQSVSEEVNTSEVEQ